MYEDKLMKKEMISFEVSKDILASLNLGSKALSSEIRLMAAIEYFKNKRLSLGKAAELAGINRLEFMDILSAKGIVHFDYDEDELETELEGIKKI